MAFFLCVSTWSRFLPAVWLKDAGGVGNPTGQRKIFRAAAKHAWLIGSGADHILVQKIKFHI